MSYSTRLLRKLALGLGVTTAASLALSGVAGAAIITVQPDGNTGSDNLSPAIATANTNADAQNTIVLTAGRYTPSSPITISKNVTLTTAHNYNASGRAEAQIDGSNFQAGHATSDLFTINTGVTLTLDAVEIDSGAAAGQTAVRDNGNLVMWGAALYSSNGSNLAISSGATATVNESTIGYSAQNEVDPDSGSLVLNNSDIIGGNAVGINDSGGTYTLNNSLVIAQVGAECLGGVSQNGGPGSMDDDGTCGVQNSANSTVDSFIPFVAGSNGGPTLSPEMSAGSPTVGAGVSSLCPTVDERFYVNPSNGSGGHTCDIGAVTNAATADTTGPSCVVTRTVYPPTVPAAQQDVTVTDTGAGMGPLEAGSATDPFTPGPTAINPADEITDLSITNGSVSFTPFTAPSNSGLVLTATKSNQTLLTQWQFEATDWAGNSTFCK